jgi:hypothetical protein
MACSDLAVVGRAVCGNDHEFDLVARDFVAIEIGDLPHCPECQASMKDAVLKQRGASSARFDHFTSHAASETRPAKVNSQ